MGMYDWAKQELEFAGYKADDDEDGPNKWMREGTLELIKVFGEQGHSGGSAPHAVKLFERLASWKPLTPLTGSDEEWVEVGDGVFQNKRASNVFKENGKARWIDGIVFWEWYEGEDGKKHKSYFTGTGSSVDITFPFVMPDKPEYRERVESEE